MIKALWKWLRQCACLHRWGPVQTYKYGGYGIAEIICTKCGERHVYEFWYNEKDDPSR